MNIEKDNVEKVYDLIAEHFSTTRNYIWNDVKDFIDKIENNIDYYNKSLKPLNSFILPGGSEASTLLHQSRTIARRAERETSLLSSIEDINIQSLIYLNRLSDLLFVLCRVLNENGLNDVLWIPGLNQK